MTTNLVHNAIVHNLPEQGTVWVTTSVHPESVVLTVENTGEKLTPQLVSTLAEPFQRGTERIRTDHAGVGLGLAIVKSITQAHDGTLTLTPRAAGGLRVTVQLPAAPPTRQMTPRGHRIRRRGAAPRPVGRGTPRPSGSRGVDRSSTRYIAATTRAPPTSIRLVRLSPPRVTANRAAKTGSSAITIAARVAVRWACAQVCAQRASAPAMSAM